MNYPEPIRLNETTSTNSYLADLCQRQDVAELTCVYTAFQSAGRGQRGNSWESEPGKNLLFSFVTYPDFLEARRQFLLSQVTALALQEVLSQYAEHIAIKWPNDIYWKDKKSAVPSQERGSISIKNAFPAMRRIRSHFSRLRDSYMMRKKSCGK